MADKIKGSLSSVLDDISPFLKKRFLRSSYIEADNVSIVCNLVRRKYNNVEIEPKPGADGRPYLNVNVRRWITGGKVSYPIFLKGRHRQTHDPLSWIDRMEEWDAMI